MSVLKIHAQLRKSLSNGPGVRYVIWLQGCTLDCPGCFNPETHDSGGGEEVSVETLSNEILSSKEGIEGLTVSGGEPFQQSEGLYGLLESIKKKSDLSVIVFTGFTLKEIQEQSALKRCLTHIDVLIAGRYVSTLSESEGWLGSQNQKYHFLTQRYSNPDLHATPKTEVQISKDGEIRFTGIRPLKNKGDDALE